MVFLNGQAIPEPDSLGRRVSDEQRRLTMRTLRTAFLSSLVLELLATSALLREFLG